ncbi:MAG: hypothetical protein EAZ64_08100 [Sphingobacteriales bacterium]|nr:MAG: hypothetical protein EAZ64_08100 [Sphingobacteriales bacterium]
MNFLSHFYFDGLSRQPYQILGGLLPDLVKNADKSWNIYPEKLPISVFDNPHHLQILKGWNRHLQVDKLFHSSAFFAYHLHQIKQPLLGLLKGTAIKPFFLAHISIELLLDSLLITENRVDVEDLYLKLNEINDTEILYFLRLNQIQDIAKFQNFYSVFKTEKYLSTYAHTHKISYALKRICMRIWDTPISQTQEIELTEILNAYKIKLSQDFIFIFDHIAAKLLT